MKKIFKPFYAAIILFCSVSFISNAQNTGAPYGDSYDINVVNSDYSNNFSQLRLQTNTNTAFIVSNFGNKFGLNYSTSSQFQDNSVTSASSLFTVMPNGNVGIGTSTPATILDVNGVVSIRGTNVLNFGADVSDKEINAGKIGYNTFDDGGGTGSLNIVGGGTTYANRKVKIWSEGGMEISGNLGLGTSTPAKKLTVVGGSIQPSTGNTEDSGVYFPINPGGGGGDQAYIRHYVESGENTKLVIGIANDADDDISFVQAGAERMNITNGNVGIGTTASSTFKLSVKGKVNATDYSITSSTGTWSDYVFANDYKLPTLKETETFINANKHLPNFPSEAEIKEKGYTVHDMNNNFLKTIEEMTLHSIEQEKKINTMASELAEIKALLLQKK